MGTTYNLPTLLKLVDAVFDLEGLNDFCYLHFRPVYDQFQPTDRKNTRVRRLVEYAERKGRLDDLLNLIRAESPGQYEAVAGQLDRPTETSGDVTFNQQHQRVGTQYNVAGDLNIGSKSPTSLLDSDEQREILHVIYLSQQENPKRYVDDVYIAEELNSTIEDVRMHLDLLEEKALVKQAKTYDGTGALLTPRGRLIVRG